MLENNKKAAAFLLELKTLIFREIMYKTKNYTNLRKTTTVKVVIANHKHKVLAVFNFLRCHSFIIIFKILMQYFYNVEGRK